MMFRWGKFPIKRLPDGRALLNVGSSARVAVGWNNLDFSWLLRLARYPSLCRLLKRLDLLSAARYERTLESDPAAIVWDLRYGIPFPDFTFDVVYHCHVLEHIEREKAAEFLLECRRVLKAGGILRIVVPDLEALARRYLACIDSPQDGGTLRELCLHTEALFDQMIVRTPYARRGQPWIVRVLEDLLIGDTARAGVLHRWMYDRLSLAALLSQCGFGGIAVHGPTSSNVAGWQDFMLDTEADGSIYKPQSLYVEAQKLEREAA